MEVSQVDQVKLNQEHKEKLIELGNQVLRMRLNYLELMSQHYQDYWVEADLKYYEARLNWLVAKEEYQTLKTRAERINTDIKKLKQESSEIQQQSDQLKSRLALYHKLDSNLLAEYRRIKDDLECQDLIIEIGASNRSEANFPCFN